MAAENPLGFGGGRSGEAYMQWYQPIASGSGYRTMVNSYLTFLVERGWMPAALVFVVGSMFWCWAGPGGSGSAARMVATGMRASILGFLVAGIFSTTMEEPVLWIIPTCCFLGLLIWLVVERVPVSRSQVAWAVAWPVVLLLVLYLGGLSESRNDTLARRFVTSSSGYSVSSLRLKSASSSEKTWVVMPDPAVLGPCYGKLLRQLVSETGIVLKLERPADLHGQVDRLLLVGKAIHGPTISSACTTILLTPSVIESGAVQAWLNSSPHIVLLVPSIDEDGRARFWRDSALNPAPPHVTFVSLDGIGLRADWAWDQVIDLVRHS